MGTTWSTTSRQPSSSTTTPSWSWWPSSSSSSPSPGKDGGSSSPQPSPSKSSAALPQPSPSVSAVVWSVDQAGGGAVGASQVREEGRWTALVEAASAAADRSSSASASAPAEAADAAAAAASRGGPNARKRKAVAENENKDEAPRAAKDDMRSRPPSTKKPPKKSQKIEGNNDKGGATSSLDVKKSRKKKMKPQGKSQRSSNGAAETEYDVGFKFMRFFPDYGWYEGTIESKTATTRGGAIKYRCRYSDGCQEHLTSSQMDDCVSEQHLKPGDVGFRFCKAFRTYDGRGIFNGTVTAVTKGGKRKCVFEDGEEKTLTVEQLTKLYRETHDEEKVRCSTNKKRRK